MKVKEIFQEGDYKFHVDKAKALLMDGASKEKVNDASRHSYRVMNGTGVCECGRIVKFE